MTKVGLLSDTHGYWDEKYLQYFETCDEIWHAGDIGSLEVAQKLAAFRPFRAVLPYTARKGRNAGFHKVRTMVRFIVDNGVFKDLEVIELAG